MPATWRNGWSFSRRPGPRSCIPIVVGVVCSIVVTCLLIFVVPVFSQLYRKMHVQLPGPTRVLVPAQPGAAVLVVAAAARDWRAWCWACAACWPDPKVRLRWDRLKIRMPLLGPLNRCVLVSQFVRTFGMLISVGVPIIEALETAGRVARNEEIRRITDGPAAGDSGRPPDCRIAPGARHLSPRWWSNSSPPARRPAFCPEMLAKAADLLDKDADRLAASLLVKLEPALTVLMGLVIGLILMGVYLPMFDYMAHL